MGCGSSAPDAVNAAGFSSRRSPKALWPYRVRPPPRHIERPVFSREVVLVQTLLAGDDGAVLLVVDTGEQSLLEELFDPLALPASASSLI
jgi:hypothetical protein